MKSMCSFGSFSFPPRVHTLLSGGLDWALHSGSSSLPAWRCKRLEWLSNRMTVECSTRRSCAARHIPDDYPEQLVGSGFMHSKHFFLHMVWLSFLDFYVAHFCIQAGMDAAAGLAAAAQSLELGGSCAWAVSSSGEANQTSWNLIS